MTGEQAVAQATAYFDSGEFKRVLARRVAMRSESQREDRDEVIQAYPVSYTHLTLPTKA